VLRVALSSSVSVRVLALDVIGFAPAIEYHWNGGVGINAPQESECAAYTRSVHWR
jgi:hypothetical protein